MKKLIGKVAGIAGVAFIGYCIYSYFDRKLRSQTVRENAGRRERQIFISEEEMLAFYRRKLRLSQRMIARGEYEVAVENLVNAVFICEYLHVNSFLQMLRSALPDNIFNTLLVKLREISLFVDHGMAYISGTNAVTSAEGESENDEEEERETIMDLSGI